MSETSSRENARDEAVTRMSTEKSVSAALLRTEERNRNGPLTLVLWFRGGLINAWFKTERAKKHLDELNQFLNQCYLSFPGSSLTEENGRRILRVAAPEPHVWIFLIAGDFFSCLRAALDHAVWRIASLHVGCPRDVVQFPIIGVNNKNGRERPSPEPEILLSQRRWTRAQGHSCSL